MSLRSQAHTGDERCDKCDQPMTVENPGIMLSATTKENGRQNIWLHIHELKRAIHRAELELSPQKSKKAAA